MIIMLIQEKQTEIENQKIISNEKQDDWLAESIPYCNMDEDCESCQ